MKYLSRTTCAVVAFALPAGLVSIPASAGIVSFGGSVVIADPPANIDLGMWESDTEARVWLEQSAVLGSALAVNAVNTGGVWQNGSGNVPGSIPASTAVTSYMLRTDPVGDGTALYSGFLVFDQPVIGLVFFESRLNSTDSLLGRPGVFYNTNTDRGLEAGTNDGLTLSADRLRLDFFFRTVAATDDVRIITAVPAPTALPVLALAGVVGLVRRRRQ